MLCQYKDILGKVGQGVHSYRIANIAVMDVLATVIAAFILHALFPAYSTLLIMVVLFGLGIILHRIFCVRTTVDRWLFEQGA